jgi:two-component system chemotaxis response regulator CheY
MRRILKNLLVQIGYTAIEEAADGGAAMEKLKAVPFDLVISDWNMEPVSGLQLLRMVRATPGLQQLPFIMVTAESKVENVLEAKKCGVSNYIVKPFSAEVLKSKIDQVLSKLQAA